MIDEAVTAFHERRERARALLNHIRWDHLWLYRVMDACKQLRVEQQAGQ